LSNDLSGQRPHVLLAEDLPAYLERIVGLFTDLEINLITANDGQEAIEYIQDLGRPLDLLITDLDMPRRTGWHVIEALRVHRGEDVPVIIQSGDARYPEVQSKAAALGIVLIDKIHVDIRLIAATAQALRLPATS
jgi:CheY-like chemotaxis protein